MLENRSQAFPVLDYYEKEKIIYFDAACTYLKNIYAFEWEKEYYFKYSCCGGDRWFSLLQSELQDKIDNLRKRVLNFIWADDGDYLVFTSSATDSINRLIFSLNEDIVSDIIVSDLEHNSNILPQIEYSKLKNINLHIFPYRTFIEEIGKLENFLKFFKNKGKKFVICFTHSSNVIGGVFNIKSLWEVVHKYWWYLLIDDTQYITYNQEKAKDFGIDFLVFSSHKLGWPTWLGFLYISQKVSEIIKYSNKVWWWTIQFIHADSCNIHYRALPYYFEWWVQHFSAILGFDKLLDFFDKVGYRNIHNYILSLTEYFWNKFKKGGYDNYLDIISLPNSSLVTLKGKNNFSSQSFLQYCNYFTDYKFIFRSGTFCWDFYVNKYIWTSNLFRVSFWIYNTKDEIDIFFETLDNYIKNL